MFECMSGRCTEKATHVLVDNYHEPIMPGFFYCQQHAFEEGREECTCCTHFTVQFSLEAGDGELLPTYPSDQLDQDGYCSDHP